MLLAKRTRWRTCEPLLKRRFAFVRLIHRGELLQKFGSFAWFAKFA
jgi:hypothetical protein